MKNEYDFNYILITLFKKKMNPIFCVTLILLYSYENHLVINE